MSIVVGYIPTPEGEAALRRGIAEAQREGTRLIVVNSARESFRKDSRRAPSDMLHSVDRELTDSGIEHSVVQPTGEDEPADQILDAADADTSLIVIGLRKRTPVGKFFLGSTAQRVLMEAACPVLAVKATSD